MSGNTAADARPLSSSEFLATVKRSGLLSGSQFEGVLGRFEGAPAVLAERLVRDGILTEFQAGRLLVGNDKGLMIGRYRILDRIGGGSMGWVFKGLHELMDRVVAIKIISPRSAMGPDSLRRFLLEMKIVALLDHPNVVRAFDGDLFENTPYMVMEYVTGENLDQIARRRGPLPPDEVVDYMAQAARGMAHAHERGVIHRDIKPSNLALDDSGVLKILDLGLGAFVDVSGEESYLSDVEKGIAVGTADYMSPEQLGGQLLDGRTDLFSLGCTMYYLIAGTYAFPGPQKIDRLIKRMHEPHVPLQKVRAGVPYPVLMVVDKLLALDPADRFATAADAAEALQSLTPSASRSGRASRSPAGEKKTTETPAPSPQADPKTLDWSRIETGLHAKEEPAPSAPPLERLTPRPGRLESHRKSLEAGGEDSGREVHRQYRNELIQMKREGSGNRSPDEAPRSAVVGWLETAGEHVGHFLSEPGAKQNVMIVVLAVITGVLFLTLLLK